VTQRLLAIDDNLDSAELIVRVANKCGYEARAIADSGALSGAMADWVPDIVTLDLCMPQDDGIAMLSLLQEKGFCGNLLIISGQDEWFRKTAGRLALGRGLKVVADLSKPISIKELREILTTLLSGFSGSPAAANSHAG
jgi:two-component system chemotaxis response regulator CheB